MIIPASKVTKIARANPQRNKITITNLTNSTVYICKTDDPGYDFARNGFPINIYGVFDEQTNPPNGYFDELYAYTTVESDVRVFES